MGRELDRAVAESLKKAGQGVGLDAGPVVEAPGRPGRQRGAEHLGALCLPGRARRGQGQRLARARLAHHDLGAVARGHESTHHLDLLVGEEREPTQRRGQRVGADRADPGPLGLGDVSQEAPLDAEQLERGVAELAAAADRRQGDDLGPGQGRLGDGLDLLHRRPFDQRVGQGPHDVAALERRRAGGQTLGTETWATSSSTRAPSGADHVRAPRRRSSTVVPRPGRRSRGPRPGRASAGADPGRWQGRGLDSLGARVASAATSAALAECSPTWAR